MEGNNIHNERLVVLATYNTPIEAQIAKSVLDSANIYCVLYDDYMSSIYSANVFPARLLVRAEDAEVAEKLLRVEH